MSGKVHIYYGDGKGKTTAGMGLVLRAAGAGKKVLLYQFMKDNTSSERNILKRIPEIVVEEGPEHIKFGFQMSEEEKEAQKAFYKEIFQKIVQRLKKESWDVLFLDEIIYTISAGLFPEEELITFLKERPDSLEIILTGNTPDDALKAQADYVSHIKKEKHPFDEGLAARRGIEL